MGITVFLSTMIKTIRWVCTVVLLCCHWLVPVATGQCNTSNFAFKGGEKATYNAFYNWHFVWMNAGLVTFTAQTTQYQSKPVYKLMAVGNTLKAYDNFYKVRDTFVSYVDTAGLKPYFFQRKTSEGSYLAYENTKFDYDKNLISMSISKDKEPYVNTSLLYRDCTFDVLSMVYRARNIDFGKCKINDKIPMRMVVDGEISDLFIRYLGKEQVTTREGRTFNCVKFSPLLMEGTIFEAGEGMTVWVTDDRNRIPIVVEAKILIGSVKAVFVGIENARYPITAEVK